MLSTLAVSTKNTFDPANSANECREILAADAPVSRPIDTQAWDNLLLYATGGLAYGKVGLAGSLTDAGVVVAGPAFSLTSSYSASRLNAGWAAGAGVEAPLGRNWTWKAEYLYVDLGALNVAATGPVPSEMINIHARFTDNVVRAGLNYQFH